MPGSFQILSCNPRIFPPASPSLASTSHVFKHCFLLYASLILVSLFLCYFNITLIFASCISISPFPAPPEHRSRKRFQSEILLLASPSVGEAIIEQIRIQMGSATTALSPSPILIHIYTSINNTAIVRDAPKEKKRENVGIFPNPGSGE